MTTARPCCPTCGRALPGTARRWHRVDEDHLRALVAEGLSDGAIGAALGHPPSSITSARKRLGLASGHARKSRADRVVDPAVIAQLAREGKSNAEIAAATGWKVPTIAAAAARGRVGMTVAPLSAEAVRKKQAAARRLALAGAS